ncbi:MAG: hypothetical protein GY854_34075 [Deltaproteobacteria bacterium]|nr:hypothetical protein [Deltaproteobacteria bacterium]
MGPNEITDISPLVDNASMGIGDDARILDNPIDCDDQAANIQALIDRNVEFWHDCD